MQVTSVAGGYQLTVNGSISNPPASMSVGFTDQNGSPISAFSVTNNNLAMNKAYVSADTFGAHVSNGNITQNIISLQPNASFAGTTVTITPFDSSGNAYPQFAVQINL